MSRFLQKPSVVVAVTPLNGGMPPLFRAAVRPQYNREGLTRALPAL